MKNQSMLQKLKTGEAINLSSCPRTPEGFVILSHEPMPDENGDWKDYCLHDTEEWVWWILEMRDGRILAGTNPRQMPVAPEIKRLIWMR